MASYEKRRFPDEAPDGFIAFLPIRWTEKNGDECLIPVHRLGP